MRSCFFFSFGAEDVSSSSSEEESEDEEDEDEEDDGMFALLFALDGAGSAGGMVALESESPSDAATGLVSDFSSLEEEEEENSSSEEEEDEEEEEEDSGSGTASGAISDADEPLAEEESSDSLPESLELVLSALTTEVAAGGEAVV